MKDAIEAFQGCERRVFTPQNTEIGSTMQL